MRLCGQASGNCICVCFFFSLLSRVIYLWLSGIQTHYCSYESDVPLSLSLLPDNPDYRFYSFSYRYPSLVYPRSFVETEITYPEPDTICVRYVHILYPCFTPRYINQQTVPEYIVYKANPPDPQWNWYQIDCYLDPVQREQIAGSITSQINYYSSLYNGVEKYPEVYPGRDKILFFTLVMTRGGVTVEPPSADECLIHPLSRFRLFAFIHPSIKYPVSLGVTVVDKNKLGGRESGRGGKSQGVISHGRGLGGYEIRN